MLDRRIKEKTEKRKDVGHAKQVENMASFQVSVTFLSRLKLWSHGGNVKNALKCVSTKKFPGSVPRWSEKSQTLSLQSCFVYLHIFLI